MAALFRNQRTFVPQPATRRHVQLSLLLGDGNTADDAIIVLASALVLDSTSVQTEFLLRLPTELLLQIVSYITNRDDLYSLYATCRTLSLIVRHSLYNCIDTRPPPPPFTGRSIRDDHRPFNAAQHQKIFRTLRSQPHISSLVTELRVALPKCTKDQFKPARGFWTGPKDWCRAIEKHLALALVQLVNLEVLDFQCGLCPIRLDSVSRGKKHDYLCKLGAKHLRELRLSCVCRESRDLAETRTILSAPCLQSITTLSWDIQLSCVQWEVTGDMSQLDQCLLHLHTLSYDANPLLDRLVTLRRIRHLEASRDEWTPLTALSSPDVARNLRFLVLYRRGHSSLCYYQQPNHSAELWMQTCLPNNAQSYSNLRHVGIFDFFGTPVRRPRAPDLGHALICENLILTGNENLARNATIMLASALVFDPSA
ncbi:hypothetical protein M408DRAFT_26942 [Serendipita vermifera MAFF 305830]|uniref:F-box domain-containing protein n=1 Tax=Serendipita vermifera MAFF 305830 TaxID=933852 RepID=A0A0C2X565_SERVB|nr:hypothetical protein M408DRAFT_26942 [Serendipita vermifera MAFF 305830]